MRYFIEVAYDGLLFSGFQIQNNATTIQSVIENALRIIVKEKIELTGSSRTDAEVNAYQNFFHFDFDGEIEYKVLYNINAILPPQIVVKSIKIVTPDAHSRFSAISRTYIYKVEQLKNPFTYKKAYFFPFKLNVEKLHIAASIIKSQTNYSNFCKTNAQVNNYNCQIMESEWQVTAHKLQYTVEANRFLRGMVKALVGTSLLFGREKISEKDFLSLFSFENNHQKANFTPPGYALYLKQVKFSENIFKA